MAEPQFCVRSVELTNFRCFERLQVTLHPHLTVLVAENGVGKTSVLDALMVAAGPLMKHFELGAMTHLERSDIRLIPEIDASGRTAMTQAVGGAKVVARFEVGFEGGTQQEIQCARLLGDGDSSRTTTGSGDLAEYGRALSAASKDPATPTTLPVVAYYGTGRLWHHKKVTAAKVHRGGGAARAGRD